MSVCSWKQVLLRPSEDALVFPHNSAALTFLGLKVSSPRSAPFLRKPPALTSLSSLYVPFLSTGAPTASPVLLGLLSFSPSATGPHCLSADCCTNLSSEPCTPSHPLLLSAPSPRISDPFSTLSGYQPCPHDTHAPHTIHALAHPHST